MFIKYSKYCYILYFIRNIYIVCKYKELFENNGIIIKNIDFKY